ncbi:hypothetical protein BC629DRAFT_1445623 [Irpex lacteus]|nr:hypothetical protein BC629DRAFT_1445623 [Irpex lacteus]
MAAMMQLAGTPKREENRESKEMAELKDDVRRLRRQRNDEERNTKNAREECELKERTVQRLTSQTEYLAHKVELLRRELVVRKRARSPTGEVDELRRVSQATLLDVVSKYETGHAPGVQSRETETKTATAGKVEATQQRTQKDLRPLEERIGGPKGNATTPLANRMGHTTAGPRGQVNVDVPASVMAILNYLVPMVDDKGELIVPTQPMHGFRILYGIAIDMSKALPLAAPTLMMVNPITGRRWTKEELKAYAKGVPGWTSDLKTMSAKDVAPVFNVNMLRLRGLDRSRTVVGLPTITNAGSSPPWRFPVTPAEADHLRDAAMAPCNLLALEFWGQFVNECNTTPVGQRNALQTYVTAQTHQRPLWAPFKRSTPNAARHERKLRRRKEKAATNPVGVTTGATPVLFGTATTQGNAVKPVDAAPDAVMADSTGDEASGLRSGSTNVHRWAEHLANHPEVQVPGIHRHSDGRVSDLSALRGALRVVRLACDSEDGAFTILILQEVARYMHETNYHFRPSQLLSRPLITTAEGMNVHHIWERLGALRNDETSRDIDADADGDDYRGIMDWLEAVDPSPILDLEDTGTDGPSPDLYIVGSEYNSVKLTWCSSESYPLHTASCQSYTHVHWDAHGNGLLKHSTSTVSILPLISQNGTVLTTRLDRRVRASASIAWEGLETCVSKHLGGASATASSRVNTSGILISTAARVLYPASHLTHRPTGRSNSARSKYHSHIQLRFMAFPSPTSTDEDLGLAMNMTEESVALSTALSTSITPTVDMTRSKAMREEESAAFRSPTVTAYQSQSSHTSHPELYDEKRYYRNKISHLISCHVNLAQEYDRWLAAEVQAKNARAPILAATIPSELLDRIAGYVSSCTKPHCNCAGGNKKGYFYHRSWAPLRSGSLVCRRWANICRSNMFKGLEQIGLYYPQDCEKFIAYALHGCPSLVPIYKHISIIRVSPQSQAAPSFFHRLCVLPNNILEHIRIQFYLSGLVACGLTTLHWSIPPTVVAPYSLMSCYDSTFVEFVHMPSFSHMVTFIRHFAYTATGAYARNPNNHDLQRLPAAIMFLRLTWDNNQRDYPPQFRHPALYRRSYHPWTAVTPRDYQSTISVTGCTSNTRLCMHTMISRPTCCMHWLPNHERRWIFSLMTEVHSLLNDECDDCSNWVALVGSQWCKSGILRLSFDLRLSGSSFGDNDALPRDSSQKTGNRMIGLELATKWTSCRDPPINIDALFSWLRGNSLPRGLDVVLSWPFSMNVLRRQTRRYRPFSILQAEAYNLTFTCLTDKKFPNNGGGRDRRRIIAIDPFTLVPAGQFWEDRDDVIPSLCNIPLPTPETRIEVDIEAGPGEPD